MEKNRVIIFDDNLFFSSAISAQLKQAGVSHKVSSSLAKGDSPLEFSGESLAIVNLSASLLDPFNLVGELRKGRVAKIVGFCGHGQKELFQKGKEVGCDWVVPNSVAAKGLLNFLEQQKIFFPTPAQPEQKT